jgi:hypothetical protein
VPVFGNQAMLRLQRKCDCGGGPDCDCDMGDDKKKKEKDSPKTGLHRAAASPSAPERVPPIVGETLRSPGQTLDPQTKAFFEARFGQDFSGVRIHTGARAAQSARAVNALAYTVGRDIAFASDRFAPATAEGRRLLAHELTHVVQQHGNTAPAASRISSPGEPAEREAASAERAIQSGEAPPSVTSAAMALQRDTPDEFKKNLGSTQDQQKAITTLFAAPVFAGLWNYLKLCAAPPKQDLGPLALKVTPGLGKASGVERYGQYSPSSRTLEINPTKPEHVANPSELIDTVTHELIHAEDTLQTPCKQAGSGDAPLHGAATQTSPPLSQVKGTAQEDQLLTDVGPGASNPCEEFIDINKAAQQIIIDLIKSNIRTTKVGTPTITYLNEILRRDPRALTEYKGCRDTACKESDAARKQQLVAACSSSIMTKYMPADLKP